MRVAQTQRKRRKTETESSSQAIYRADVVLLMLLIIEVVVGVRLHPSTPPFLCVLLSPSLCYPGYVGSWLEALYLPPQTSHLQRNYPRGRHPLALHSTAVGGGVQRQRVGRWGWRRKGERRCYPPCASSRFPRGRLSGVGGEAVCVSMTGR